MTPSALLLLLPLLAPRPADDPVVGRAIPALAGPGDPHLVEGSYRIQRGDEPVLWIPPGEVLEFQVEVDLGILGEASVGTVTMSSGVEPFVAGLPMPGQAPAESGRLVGWVRTVARGGHLGYELDHSITTRFLPQDWPSVLNLEVQTGSENRKRELKIGLVDGAWTGNYRGNSHCPGCDRLEHFVKATLPWNDDYHCKKCKRAEHRLWDEPMEFAVPPETVDVLGAIYLARTLVREERDTLALHMLQKENLWDVTLTRGVSGNVKVPAGTFACREVQLGVSQPEGAEGGGAKFSGLFGIKGSIKIWVHESTGVPVLIEGDVPLGDIMDLHARIKLASYLGTPEAFGVVDAK
ncbi:MAG: DUF3108 domain-containing protein [Planctomycetes bacterium]|nr:DUF3108 domain-containing protein [Planctomycetota bacterium]